MLVFVGVDPNNPLIGALDFARRGLIRLNLVITNHRYIMRTAPVLALAPTLALCVASRSLPRSWYTVLEYTVLLLCA